MGPIKLRETGIDDRLLQGELVCATIEQVPNRHLEETDPLGFGLPIGQAIVGQTHSLSPGGSSFQRSNLFSILTHPLRTRGMSVIYL